MIRRKCPVCGKDWYSANTKEWTCTCGCVLDEKHNVNVKEVDRCEDGLKQEGKLPVGWNGLACYEITGG